MESISVELHGIFPLVYESIGIHIRSSITINPYVLWVNIAILAWFYIFDLGTLYEDGGHSLIHGSFLSGTLPHVTSDANPQRSPLLPEATVLDPPPQLRSSHPR